MKRPLWFYLPPLMHLLNWWDVRVRGKKVIRGVIEYAPPGRRGAFAPEFERPAPKEGQRDGR